MNLKEAVGKLGLDSWLFDLDDTLIPTNWAFVQQMRAYAQFVTETVGSVEQDWVWNRLTAINNQVYHERSVNPQRWEIVIDRLAEECGRPGEELLRGMHILMDIYNVRSVFSEGAEEVLKQFKNDGIPMGIVTHANEEWTWRKVEWLGLTRYVDQKSIYIVSEDRHKGPEDWSGAISRLGFEAKRTGVTGDSLPGDIIASHRAGVTRKFYIPSPWSVYNQGEIPKGTEVLGNVSGLIPAIFRLASGS